VTRPRRSPERATPRTRLDPGARRAQLVALGLEMLSTRPLDQVAIDEIATQAGISRGLLFHYFPTKRDFHLAVVQAAADDLLARTAPDPGLPVDARLRASVEAFVAHVSENSEAYTSLVRGAAGGDPGLLAVFDATRAAFADRVVAGLGLPEPPPARTVLAIRGWVAFTEEVTIAWLAAGGGEPGRDAVVDLIDRALVAVVETAAPGSTPPDLLP
jgi:AcrR family transcriptional regulator